MKACRYWHDAAYLRGPRCAPFINVLYRNSGLRYTILVKISLLLCINYVKYFAQHSYFEIKLQNLKQGKDFTEFFICPQAPFFNDWRCLRVPCHRLF